MASEEQRGAAQYLEERRVVLDEVLGHEEEAEGHHDTAGHVRDKVHGQLCCLRGLKRRILCMTRSIFFWQCTDVWMMHTNAY